MLYNNITKEYNMLRSTKEIAFKKFRTDNGLSQREIALLMNVDRSQVGKWETGKLSIPDNRMEQLSGLNLPIDRSRKIKNRNLNMFRMAVGRAFKSGLNIQELIVIIHNHDQLDVNHDE